MVAAEPRPDVTSDVLLDSSLCSSYIPNLFKGTFCLQQMFDILTTRDVKGNGIAFLLLLGTLENS